MRRGLRRLLLPLLVLALATQGYCAELLVPGGQVVGMVLRTGGILVAGFSEDAPAQAAGVQEGDVILSVNGVPVETAQALRDALQEGRQASLKLRRGEEKLHLTVNLTQDGERYALGVLVKEGVSGLGTISYYDPETGGFGALGHGVNDQALHTLLPLREGSLVEAAVTGVTRGEVGSPGSLQGTFSAQEILGAIHQNTAHGIFGALAAPLEGEALPIGTPEPGPAVIRATVDERGVQEYQARILRVDGRDAAEGRNLLLEVTDPALLERTGGIVQGMSGSPVLQNGLLVAAVTHVLVGDPTRGYGISMENMRKAAGSLPAVFVRCRSAKEIEESCCSSGKCRECRKMSKNF